jgi:NAD+ diphosphatase
MPVLKQAFHLCPVCGSKDISYDSLKKYRCCACEWEFYQNTAAAVAGILEFDGKVLAVIRNREPGLGKLDFPGGFVDPLESAEQALEREIREELNVELNSIRYLCSAPNIYSYKNVEYCTCDIFFTAKLKTDLFKIEQTEIAGYNWFAPEELNPEEFAFQSMREAITSYKALAKSH